MKRTVHPIMTFFLAVVFLAGGVWRASCQETEPATSDPTPPKAAAEPPVLLTAQEHPWGRFAPKTWVCSQTVTWTHQENQQTVQIRDTKTTLESVDKDGVTLKSITTVHVGGRRIESAPTSHRFDFFLEPIRDNVRIDHGGEGKLIINNIVIPCKKRIYEHKEGAEKQRAVLWYSTQLYPYVLYVENVLSRLPNEGETEEKILRRSITEVLDSSSLQRRWNRDGGYRMRTRKTDGNISTVTETVCSLYVPGGVIQETTREFDAAGKEVRTLETKLINYHCAVEENENENPELVPGDPFPFYELPIPRRPRWRRMHQIPLYY